MLTFLIQDFNNDEIDEWALSVKASDETNRRFTNRLVIFLSETYEKAINDHVWEKLWLEIIQTELIVFIANEIWKTIVLLKNVNIVINKWVFKAKMHIDDTLNKLKVRLIVKDFSQMFEVNFINIFASIVKFDTLRLFLVIIALKDLECHQMNVNNAFINFFLKKIIYMKFSLNVNLFSN